MGNPPRAGSGKNRDRQSDGGDLLPGTGGSDIPSRIVASGVQRVQLDSGVPCAFGVITAENMDQALARSGGDKRDQGRGAAIVAMRMALLRETLS